MKTVIVVVVIALLGLGGFFFMNSQNKSKTTPSTQAAKTTSGNAITSIKDALSKSVSLSCSYAGENGAKYTSYIKAGAVLVETADAKYANQMGNIIMKDNKMYMWNNTTKTGISYTIETPTGMPSAKSADTKNTMPGNDANSQQDSVMAQMEKYKDSCKPAVISDSLFTPPTDVKFQDYSQMMNKMMKTSLSITPGQGSSEDYQKAAQKMMDQYKSGQ